MPRLERVDSPGVLHNVMGWFIERKEVYFRQAAFEARGSFSWIEVRELSYSSADFARYCPVSNCRVARIVASSKKGRCGRSYWMIVLYVLLRYLEILTFWTTGPLLECVFHWRQARLNPACRLAPQRRQAEREVYSSPAGNR